MKSFSWLQLNYQSVLNLDSDALIYVIEQSCRNKAEVVAQDERESGLQEQFLTSDIRLAML